MYVSPGRVLATQARQEQVFDSRHLYHRSTLPPFVIISNRKSRGRILFPLEKASRCIPSARPRGVTLSPDGSQIAATLHRLTQVLPSKHFSGPRDDGEEVLRVDRGTEFLIHVVGLFAPARAEGKAATLAIGFPQASKPSTSQRENHMVAQDAKVRLQRALRKLRAEQISRDPQYLSWLRRHPPPISTVSIWRSHIPATSRLSIDHNSCGKFILLPRVLQVVH